MFRYFSIPSSVVDIYGGQSLHATNAMPQLTIGQIMSRELSGKPCQRILSGDGVTTPDLTIKAAPGLFAGVSVDVRSARKSVPEIGEAASAARNLDEYQFLICSFVPSLPDSDQSKLELQKYRIAIIAAFVKLVGILNSNPVELGEWSRNARWLVEETSEAFLQAKSNVKLHPMHRDQVFDYFRVPSQEIIAALRTFYGYPQQ